MRWTWFFSVIASGLAMQMGLPSAAHAQLGYAVGRVNGSMRSDGRTRTYVLRIPPQYDRQKPLPLVVALHGWTTSGALMEMYSGMALAADRYGFILASPDGLGNPRGWNAGFVDLSGVGADDTAFISRLIDKLTRELKIDRQRIYVVGHSNGAMLANYIGTQLGDRVAAIGIVAGTIGIPDAGGKERRVPLPSRPISVMVIHGRKDPMVAFQSRSEAILRGVGAFDSASWWARQIHADTKPDKAISHAGSVTTWTWPHGRNNTEVCFVALGNGYHDWPGGWTKNGRERSSRFNATDALWKFFSDHPKPKNDAR